MRIAITYEGNGYFDCPGCGRKKLFLYVEVEDEQIPRAYASNGRCNVCLNEKNPHADMIVYVPSVQSVPGRLNTN